LVELSFLKGRGKISSFENGFEWKFFNLKGKKLKA
jgi:hypothetical protein